MPRVPRIDQIVRGLPQSRPTQPAFQSGRGATPEAFGAGTARGLQRVGEAVQQTSSAALEIVKKQQAEEAARIARQRQVEFREGASQLWHGTEDSPGFGLLRGEDALAAEQEYREALATLRDEMLDGVPQSVRSALRAQLDILALQENDTASRHVQRERRVANEAAVEASLATSVDAALRDFRNPSTISREEARGRETIRSFWEFQGLPSEAITAKQMEFSSALHRSVIDRMLADNDFRSAESHFQGNMERIDATLHGAIRKAINSHKEQISQELVARAKNEQAFIATFGRLPPSYGATQAALSSIPGERGQRLASEHRQLGQIIGSVNEFQQRPIAEQAAMLQGLQERATVEDVPLFQALSSSLSETAKAARDGTILELYANRGEIELPQVSFGEPDTMLMREAVSNRLSNQLGIPVSPLTRSEVEGLQETLENAPPTEVAAILHNLQDGFSEDAFDAITNDISTKRPALAAIMSVSKDDVSTARDMLRGDRLAKDNPDFVPSRSERLAAIDDTGLVEALQLAPEVLDAYVNSAVGLFVERRLAGNSEYELADAINEVTGLVRYNGLHVIPPRGWTEDQFEAAINGLTFKDMVRLGNGSPVYTDAVSPFDPELFRNGDAQLVTFSRGRFRVLIPGLGYVVTNNGTLYEINLNSVVPPDVIREGFLSRVMSGVGSVIDSAREILPERGEPQTEAPSIGVPTQRSRREMEEEERARRREAR